MPDMPDGATTRLPSTSTSSTTDGVGADSAGAPLGSIIPGDGAATDGAGTILGAGDAALAGVAGAATTEVGAVTMVAGAVASVGVEASVGAATIPGALLTDTTLALTIIYMEGAMRETLLEEDTRQERTQ